MWQAIILILLVVSASWAGELVAPAPTRDVPHETQRYLRSIYDNFHKPPVTEDNPNGSRQGDKGELIIYDNSGTFKLCINVDDGGGTTWRCTSSLSAP